MKLLQIQDIHASAFEQVSTILSKGTGHIGIKRAKIHKDRSTFVDDISGLVIAKMLDKKEQSIAMLKLKFVQYLTTLDRTNNSLDKVIFDPKEMLGILNLKSIEYYKIKQGTFQQNLNKYYRFESAHILCEQFNKFVNT